MTILITVDNESQSQFEINKKKNINNNKYLLIYGTK